MHVAIKLYTNKTVSIIKAFKKLGKYTFLKTNK